jgi:hypothetical protein
MNDRDRDRIRIQRAIGLLSGAKSVVGTDDFNKEGLIKLLDEAIDLLEDKEIINGAKA